MLVFHNVITELIRKCPYVVFYPLSTLCQSLEKSQTTSTNKVTNIPVSPYAKPTTLFNGTISCATPLSKQPDVVSYEVVFFMIYSLECHVLLPDLAVPYVEHSYSAYALHGNAPLHPS